MEVRPAWPDEAPSLAELQLRSAVAGYRHIFPADAPKPRVEELAMLWHRILDDREWSAFVADSGAEVVGVVAAGPEPADAEVGHLARLYVAPERWGEGIGAKLYGAALAQLVTAGYPEATLWVLEANLRARRWYERLGWQPTGSRKVVYKSAGIFDVGYRRQLG